MFSPSSLGWWESRLWKQSPALYSWPSVAFFFPKMLQDRMSVNTLGVTHSTKWCHLSEKARLLPAFFSTDSASNVGAFWAVDKGGEGRKLSASSRASCRSGGNGSAIQACCSWPAAKLSGGCRICSMALVLLIEDACRQTWHGTIVFRKLPVFNMLLLCTYLSHKVKL